MSSFGSYYKGEKRKKKKEILEKQAGQITKVFAPPKVEIIGKKEKG